MSIVEDEELLDDYSWTYQWHWNELAALIQNQIDCMMNHEEDNPTQKVTYMEWKCHVQERPATIKCYVLFPKFSPVIADQYLFIF